jgi:hypothetical protein
MAQVNPSRKWRRVPALCALALQVGLSGPHAQPAKEDSGWVSLFNGKDFGNGFYVYSAGYIAIEGQTKFKVDSGMVHAGGPYALLITSKEYSYYRIRVDYRFGPAVGANGNAGMMILMDNQAAKTVTSLRPRSIEINCRRDNGYPWSLWSALDQGPAMTTTVKPGTVQYQAQSDGGVAYTLDSTGNRTLESIYPNPELPVGQWNHGSGSVFGDSGVFYLNGKLRTSSWRWMANQGGKKIRVARGGVGLQTEGHDIWYRNWEIQELDSATLLPIHARRGCTDPKRPNFDPRAVVADGSCLPASLAGRPPALPKSRLAPESYGADGRARSALKSGRTRRPMGPLFNPVL